MVFPWKVLHDVAAVPYCLSYKVNMSLIDHNVVMCVILLIFEGAFTPRECTHKHMCLGVNLFGVGLAIGIMG